MLQLQSIIPLRDSSPTQCCIVYSIASSILFDNKAHQKLLISEFQTQRDMVGPVSLEISLQLALYF